MAQAAVQAEAQSRGGLLPHDAAVQHPQARQLFTMSGYLARASLVQCVKVVFVLQAQSLQHVPGGLQAQLAPHGGLRI